MLQESCKGEVLNIGAPLLVRLTLVNTVPGISAIPPTFHDGLELLAFTLVPIPWASEGVAVVV